MAATDGQITVAAARWTDEGNYLREFVAKHHLPAVVKIIKGQYGGLGVPTLPSPGLQSTALLVSAGKRQKIIAQAVKIKEGRRLVCVGPRLVIPDTYPGYFELLSEEGRAVRCIESVAELARRRPEEGCLVRETIRGVHHQAKTTDAAEGGGGVIGARTIPAGEILVPSGGVTTSGSSNSNGDNTSSVKGRYLKCVDSLGDTILLGMEQRGKFSALAREDNISGVHTAKNLLSKRLPLTVRLVHGTAPRGLKSPSHFVPELRLLSVFEEEHVFALPLQKETQNVTALPLAAPLKLLRTRNDDQLRNMIEFHRLVDKCTKLAGDVADRIQVLDGKLGDSKKSSGHHHHHHSNNNSSSSDSTNKTTTNGFLLRRSASSDSANHRTNKHISLSSSSHHRRDETRTPSIVVHSKDYDEIDQIYDYVRGFAPLPKNIRSTFIDPATTTTPLLPSTSLTSSNTTTTSPSQQHHHHHHQIATSISNNDLSIKPEPPPIETIPTKKLQAEKRNRKGATSSSSIIMLGRDAITTTTTTGGKSPVVHHHHSSNNNNNSERRTPPGLPKLYVKNGQSQRSRLLRQKSASPMKETPPSAPLSPMSKSGSPLFNIRYKSLNNLAAASQQQAMELDGGGTLDSSNSGGRASGDSGVGVGVYGYGHTKQPEKRSRKLSRPKSLTNLVWEIREHPDISMPPILNDKNSMMMMTTTAKKIIEPAAIVYKKHSKYSVNGQSHQRRGTLYL